MRKAVFTRVTIALSVLSAALVLSALFTPYATRADEFIGGFLKASDRSLAVSGAMYNSSLPTLTSGNYANVEVDSNGRIILSPSSSVTASLTLPYSGSVDEQAPVASSFIGAAAVDTSTGQISRLTENGTGQLFTLSQLSAGSAVIGTVTANSWTPVIVTGAASGSGDGFGGGCSPTPTCNVVIKGSPGVLLSIRFNSTAALGTTVLGCWNATTIGATSIANQIFVGTNMSAGANPTFGSSGGEAFSTGLICQTSVALGTSQNFSFEVR